MVQAGLFDRRAVLGAARRQTAREAQLQEIDAHLEALDRTGPLVGRVEVAAALILRGASR
jgi:hypothetical protein